MVFQESENVELKKIVVDDIKKEIIAFANCEGGKLYVGVGGDGTVTGVPDPDNASLQISNMVRDGIKPDVTMFIHYQTLQEAKKEIVAVDVQRGTNRPYYLAKKGLRPEGVYVRQGYSSVPATDTVIRQMIKETGGDHFEARRSLVQELTFNAANKEFALRKLKFGLSQRRTLKLLNQDNLYTNLGLLLSDQCTHTIKTAVFQGTDPRVFRDRQEFSGSLLQQMNDVYAYIDMHNQTKATVEKLYRIDVRDYPETAIREALLNSLVHREYSVNTSSFIKIFADRIEFLSYGGLVSGLEQEDILTGLSVCRNQDLANVFYRLQLIEAYGTGIQKIMAEYEGFEKQPLIETTANTFKIILPNRNIQYEEKSDNLTESYKEACYEEKLRCKEELNIKGKLSNEEKVIKFVQEHGSLRKSDVIALLGVSSSTASRLLRKLKDNKLLKQTGKARDTYYVAAES
ncbi:RNA-binding domain-containing protein [Erysipelotrichaceae bacterium 51-3]